MSTSAHLPEQGVEPGRLSAQAPKRHFQGAAGRVYSTAFICEQLQISRRTFFNWKRDRKLPLFEVRVGKTIRYQALPIDRLLAGRGR